MAPESLTFTPSPPFVVSFVFYHIASSVPCTETTEIHPVKILEFVLGTEIFVVLLVGFILVVSHPFL